MWGIRMMFRGLLFILVMSCLRSRLLAYRVIGTTAVMLNSFVNLPSVSKFILVAVLVTVHGPSHLRDVSGKARTCATGAIRYFIAVVS